MINMGGVHNFGGVKAVKWQALHGSLARRLAIRTLMFALVISMLPLLQLVIDFDPAKPMYLNTDGCSTELGYFGLNSIVGRVFKPIAPFALPHLRSEMCQNNVNLTIDVVRELMGKNLLNYGSKALCIGQGTASAVSALREIGFLNVEEIRRHPFFMLKQKQVVYELDFDDNSFDFVIANDLSKVSVPAVLVSEVERILKSGGIAAITVDSDGSNHDSLIRSATTVSSFLKRSSVIDVVSLGSFTLVAFKKRGNKLGSFEQYHLPTNCPSIKRNKPLMNKIEPVIDKKPKADDKRIEYLPKLVGVPPKGKMVYVDMGAKEAANFSNSNWFLPSYPIDSKAFNVYIVDHDALVMSSHVKCPGVTFIYHPALGGSVIKDKSNSLNDGEPLVDDEDFDFLVWFKETVELADFVVLKMNMGKAEMKFLSELFESGIICYVDELFLQFSNADYDNGAGIGESHTNLFKSLRSIGVFAHQWWGN
uniref:Methyltransferase type 11 domain-containing protein n=2 Tax=Chenopodium quinoa TaxID=63459 RepID=A0A803N8T3_CHEQI